MPQATITRTWAAVTSNFCRGCCGRPGKTSAPTRWWPSRWRAFANQSKGKLFGLNYSLVVGFIRSGDINTAESYAARNRSLLAEAQRWPAFPIYGMTWQALVEDGNARIEESRGRFAAGGGCLSQGFDPLYEFDKNLCAMGKQAPGR